jgi:hypothetical protein
MPRIIETTVYRFNELEGAAKDEARNWYRNVAIPNDWHEFVLEDFEAITDILGVRLKTSTIRLAGGGTRQKPRIYFSGFSSQGDGACFEAHYRYKAGASKAIRSHAPLDTELHRIADVLQGIQRRNFFQLTADVSHRGRYYHEHSMSISVERDSPKNQSVTADAEDAITEALRDLARWLYRQLEREYEYQTSDEMIDEALLVNDYTFTESGRRFG